MKNDTIKIRCSIRSNLFKRLCDLAGLTYLEKYKFYKFFEMVTSNKVTQYMEQHKNLTYYEACCEFWLYKMFGWTEYDEEKYAELLVMPILDLYDTLNLAYKKYLEKEKLNKLESDFN